MTETTAPKILSRWARLALAHPDLQDRILRVLRPRIASVLNRKALLRVKLQKLQASHPEVRSHLLKARFEEGKSVDVEAWLRSKGLDEAADEWAKNTELYGDKFKN